MATQAIAAAQSGAGLKVMDVTPKENALSSIDDRLRDAFVSASVATQNEYASIMAKVNDAEYLSMPNGLFELQVRLGEYRLQVETISALTRKGVATAETLLRA